MLIYIEEWILRINQNRLRNATLKSSVQPLVHTAHDTIYIYQLSHYLSYVQYQLLFVGQHKVAQR